MGSAGTIPTNYTAIGTVFLAYNPLLWGPLPSFLNVGTDQGYLYATSIGLGRPLPYILADLKAGMDPANVLASWVPSLSNQPVRSRGASGYCRSNPGVVCLVSL